MQNINNCDAFFRAYILPLAEKYQIIAQKQRYNVFRITGLKQQLYDFLKNFKVDKSFMQDSKQFQILSPMCTFGEIKHYYNNGKPARLFNRTFSEGNQLIDAGNINPTTRSVDDLSQNKIQGRWFNLFDNSVKNENVPDFNVPKRIRKIKPKDLIKQIQKLLKIFDIKDDIEITIQFEVNCDKLPNNSFDYLSKDSPITFDGYNNKVLDISDKMNDTNKYIQPTTVTKMPQIPNNESLVGDTKQIIKKTKVNDFNKKNKNKTKKI